MLAAAERFPPDPAAEAYKKDVVRTLLRERLKRTPEERLEDLVALASFADELAAAGRAPGPRRRPTSPACCARCTRAGSR